MTGPVTPAEVRAAYDGGLSVRRCMTHFHMTRVMVEAALRETGTTMRRPGSQPMPAERAAEIRRVYDTGLTKVQTAEKLGIGLKAVVQGVRLAGGTMRPRGPVPR